MLRTLGVLLFVLQTLISRSAPERGAPPRGGRLFQ
jgi:hypothetical protein